MISLNVNNQVQLINAGSNARHFVFLYNIYSHPTWNFSYFNMQGPTIWIEKVFNWHIWTKYMFHFSALFKYYCYNNSNKINNNLNIFVTVHLLWIKHYFTYKNTTQLWYKCLQSYKRFIESNVISLNPRSDNFLPCNGST